MAKNQLKQEIKIEVGQTPQAKREVQKAERSMERLEKGAKEAKRSIREANALRGSLLATQGAASAGRVSGVTRFGSVTGEGFKFGLAKFSSTGLQLEGGELITKIGGPLLLAAAAGRASEGVTRGLVSFRDRIALGQDAVSNATQLGLDSGRSVVRNVANTFGIEGNIRNIYALITGASQEEASAAVEEFWDFFTLDSTKRFARQEEARQFRKAAREESDRTMEKIKEAEIAGTNDFMNTWAVPLSSRAAYRERSARHLQARLQTEKKRRDQIISDQYQARYFGGE